MNVTITLERPEEGTGSGPVRVGWLLDEDKAGVVFLPPERVRSVEMNRHHAKSASRCPAVINLESRYFVVRCPFDLHLKFVRDKDGKPALKNVLGDMSPVRGSKLAKHLHVTAEQEWRYKDRPTIQLSLPYLFIADEFVYLSQVAPFMHYRKEPLPGTIFGGRYPISVWPRPLMWAFEWHEPDKDIRLARGEPLFYALFETNPPDRPVQLVEAAKTPELTEYLDTISSAVNYVNQTFSLFKEAEARRPARLLTVKER
ncbi:MAG: hypothetical protein KDG89_16285 [Geminicoccaceae bacterium]|nr:hypothetical protein [Geminicoccaceae bacterium]